MSLTYSAPAVSITLKIIESYNIDPLPLLENLNIDSKLIEDPNARFDYEKIDQLWSDAVDIAGDENFGLRAAKYWHPSTLGALGYAWLASTNLYTAVNRLARYMSLLTEGASLDVDELDTGKSNRELSIRLQYNAISKQLPTRTDSFMAMLFAMCRANYGETFHPSSLSLTHDKPNDTSEFYAMFQCPIKFNAAENRFGISIDVAEKNLITANAQLALISDQIIVKTLARLEKNNIIAKVKAEILKQLPSGKVTNESIAYEIHMAPRSLQRKLQSEKTTFKLIFNELRQELAEKYLKNSDMKLIEIAFNLGFNEYSSFSRAFKSWTGMSPSTYRK